VPGAGTTFAPSTAVSQSGSAASSSRNVGELRVAVVELVVAELEDVEADRVHEGRVGLALEQRVVEGAGDRVAGVDLDGVGELGLELRDLGGHPWEAAELGLDLPEADVERHRLGLQVGVVVVDVEEVQLERAVIVVIDDRAGGRPADRHPALGHEPDAERLVTLGEVVVDDRHRHGRRGAAGGDHRPVRPDTDIGRCGGTGGDDEADGDVVRHCPVECQVEGDAALALVAAGITNGDERLGGTGREGGSGRRGERGGRQAGREHAGEQTGSGSMLHGYVSSGQVVDGGWRSVGAAGQRGRWSCGTRTTASTPTTV
jgi:hypothetical protein